MRAFVGLAAWCWCGAEATHLQDSDSIQYQDGQPVCEDHFDGDEHEERII